MPHTVIVLLKLFFYLTAIACFTFMVLYQVKHSNKALLGEYSFAAVAAIAAAFLLGLDYHIIWFALVVIFYVIFYVAWKKYLKLTSGHSED